MNVRENKMLDILKYISAIMILCSHCLPIFRTQIINVYYGQWLFRFCVPLFFISSGYYFNSFSDEMKKKYIARVFKIYLVSTLIYLPFVFRMANNITDFLRSIVFGYYHLWYLSALLICLCIVYFLQKQKKISKSGYMCIAVICWLIGVFFDEYIKFFDSNALHTIAGVMRYVGGVRHFMFFAFPMVLLGIFISEHPKLFKIPSIMFFLLTVVAFGLAFLETYVLIKYLGETITCDATLFNALPAVILFIGTFREHKCLINIDSTKAYRKMADIVYIVHIWVIVLVNKILGFQYQYRAVIVILISVFISWIYVKYMPLIVNRISRDAKKNSK